MTTGPQVTVRVRRRFSASPERVFDAWVDPMIISRWMFGPAVREEEIVRITNDPHVGGSFSFVVRRQGQDIDHLGHYLEMDRPHRLAFTWATADTLPDTSRVTIEIEPGDAGCELTLTHKMHPDWADYASRSEQGWTTMLDALAQCVE